MNYSLKDIYFALCAKQGEPVLLRECIRTGTDIKYLDDIMEETAKKYTVLKVLPLTKIINMNLFTYDIFAHAKLSMLRRKINRAKEGAVLSVVKIKDISNFLNDCSIDGFEYYKLYGKVDFEKFLYNNDEEDDDSICE